MSGANKIYVDSEGVVVVEVVGDQTPESVRLMGVQVEELLGQVREAGQSALILDDLTQMGYTSSETRSIVSKLAKSMDFDRVAMYGHGAMMKYGTNFMIRAFGQGDRIRYFDNLEAAKKWLRERRKH